MDNKTESEKTEIIDIEGIKIINPSIMDN